ncbi:TPA: hypothetical protein ACT15G_005798 [Raoultella planticola]
MTSKLTRDIIQSEIADFFAGVVEIHTELGGPNSVEEAQNQLTERVLACVPAVDCEPVAWMAIYHGEIYDDAIGITRSVVGAQADRFGWESALTEIIPLYPHAQPTPVVQMVPEEPPEHLMPKGNTVDATYRRGAAIQAWKQCRAAMLQTGNSPVIPDDWTGNDKANAALIMLDRIETVDPVDDDRIEGVKRIIHELAAAPQEVKGE